jgi:hypothetical protein
MLAAPLSRIRFGILPPRAINTGSGARATLRGLSVAVSSIA